MTDKLDAFLDALERRLRAQEPPNQKLTPALMAAIVSNARRDADEPDDQWLGPEPVPPGRIIDDLREDNRRLRELVIKHRARLEIDHVFDINGNRVEADLPESQDGILCRDATIGLLEREIERLTRADPTPEAGWSEWMNWAGGPCPLPRDAVFQLGDCDTLFHGSRLGNWANITRFRYRTTDPAGWLPRGDWIPPAELWEEGSPVRCEWINATVDSGVIFREGFEFRSGWTRATHIRLLPAEPAKARLPEGFRIVDGCLLSPNGRVAFAAFEIDRYGTATIRAAVKAWCAAMEDRG